MVKDHKDQVDGHLREILEHERIGSHQLAETDLPSKDLDRIVDAELVHDRGHQHILPYEGQLTIPFHVLLRVLQVIIHPQ